MAAAETFTVGPDREFSDIQPAIDAAAINTDSQWDLIEVYWEYDMSPYGIGSEITVDTPVVIIGRDTGAGLPVISASSGGMAVDSDDVVIDGLIFQYGEGSAIQISSRDNVTIQNCVLQFCGTGIAMSGSNIRVIDCIFDDVWDTAISVESAEDCVIDSIDTESIESSPDYGICISDSSGIDVLDSNIWGSAPDGYDDYYGDGIMGQGDGGSSYGIMILDSSAVQVDGCGIRGFDTGVGILLSSGTSVNDSSAWECYEDGIAVEDSPDTLVTWCHLIENGEYNVRTSGDCDGSVFFRNNFTRGAESQNVLNEGSGIRWNSTAPISYTYEDTEFTGYNGNIWYSYNIINLYDGFDDNRDGVGDTSYSSPDGVIDYYPLVTESRLHRYVYFYAPSEVVYEGDMGVPIFINLTGEVSESTSVMIELPQGTAVYDSDYTSIPPLLQGTWISFEPGETSSILHIDSIADDQIEGDKWINLSLVTGNPTPPAELVINRSRFNLTILDTSQYPSVSIETDNTTADEGGPVVPVTIVRSGAANGSVDVSFSLSGTAAAGTDYTFEPSSLHFARGERYKTINLTLLSESVDESAETIIISITETAGATTGERNVCQVTIHDMTPDVTPTPVPTEQPGPTPTSAPTPTPTPTPTPSPTPTPVPQPALPSIAFLGAEGTGDEGASAYLVIVRSGNVSVPCDVAFNIAGGSAVNGVDYTVSPAPGTVHFAAGDTSTAFRVRIFEDSVAEGPKTAIFSLTGPNGANISSPSIYTLHINDTTTAPVITFYEPGAYADTGTDVTVVIQRVGPRDAPADVLLTVQDGTAVYGKDFSCSPAPGRIQFGPGESVKTITVSVSDDSTTGNDIGAKFILSDPHGAGIGNMSTFALYIGDEASALPGNTTTVMVQIPVAEIVPGTVFSFPAIIVAVLTGYMMIWLGGRRKGGRQ